MLRAGRRLRRSYRASTIMVRGTKGTGSGAWKTPAARPDPAARRANFHVRAGLAGAALGALASVVCWAVPLALVSLGVTGAWMSTVTALAPYKSLLIGASLACLAYAWHRIHRAPAPDGAELACLAPSPHRFSRALFWLVAALVLGAVASPYLVPLLLEA